MAITVGKLFRTKEDSYKMKLIAGRNGFNNLVEWVHIIENDEVSQFLHGNEVVFTSGILNNNKKWMLNYVEKLYEAGTSAFIVNIGPYTKEIPQEVIEYCNKVKMPLFTIPWETKMVDMTRDICRRIMENEQVETSIAENLKNIIFKVGDTETQILQMERYGFLRNSSFCFVVLSFEEYEVIDKEKNIEKIKRCLERCARSINELYITFTYNECLVVALSNYKDEEINEFINEFLRYINMYYSKLKINIGVSENKEGIKIQSENFENAFKAMNLAKKKNEDVIFYSKLDLYKLLLNIKNKDILKSYYENTIGELEVYDNKNSTQLTNFLKIYLENNGSQQIVAEKMFIHRNTVTNQLKKIEKITNMNPMELDEKLKFKLALYIKNIL